MLHFYDSFLSAENEAIKASHSHPSKIYTVVQINNENFCVTTEPEFLVIERYLNGNIYNYKNTRERKCGWNDEQVIEFLSSIVRYDVTVLKDPKKVEKLMKAFKDYKILAKSLNLRE